MHKETTLRWLPVVSGIFVSTLVISNVLAVKLVSLGPFIIDAAVLVFPLSYICGDVLTEVYGYARARQIIWLGFACNLVIVLFIWAGIQLPSPPYWTMGPFNTPETAQEAYAAVFGFTPRLLLASFGGYLVGEFLNSFVLAKMKIAMRGKRLWMRTIGSTFVGQFADSTVFVLVAFAGIVPAASLVEVILSQWIVKTAYEAAATPLTYAVVAFLKKEESQDYYDVETHFTPFRWSSRISMTPFDQ